MPAIQISSSEFTTVVERALELVPRKGGRGGGGGGYGGGGGGGGDGSGLSTGAVIGIVVGLIVLCIIIAVLVRYVKFRNENKEREENQRLVHKGWVNDT